MERQPHAAGGRAAHGPRPREGRRQARAGREDPPPRRVGARPARRVPVPRHRSAAERGVRHEQPHGARRERGGRVGGGVRARTPGRRLHGGVDLLPPGAVAVVAAAAAVAAVDVGVDKGAVRRRGLDGIPRAGGEEGNGEDTLGVRLGTLGRARRSGGGSSFVSRQSRDLRQTHRRGLECEPSIAFWG